MSGRSRSGKGVEGGRVREEEEEEGGVCRGRVSDGGREESKESKGTKESKEVKGWCYRSGQGNSCAAAKPAMDDEKNSWSWRCKSPDKTMAGWLEVGHWAPRWCSLVWVVVPLRRWALSSDARGQL